jgi:mannose-1-phosphate guanylyltransferase
VYVRCSDFGWSDVGTWGSVYQLSQKDRNENMLSHDGCYAYDTSKSIVSVADGKVAVIKGLSDYIVVDTDDVLLVCPRSDEQSIKKYIDDVRFDKGEKYV